MKYILSAAFVAVSILSCSQQTPEVKKVKHNRGGMSSPGKLNVKVVNNEDPICHMEIPKFLKDTTVYKGKTYGFCNVYCKQEFKKNPKKYVK